MQLKNTERKMHHTWIGIQKLSECTTMPAEQLYTTIESHTQFKCDELVLWYWPHVASGDSPLYTPKTTENPEGPWTLQLGTYRCIEACIEGHLWALHMAAPI